MSSLSVVSAISDDMVMLYVVDDAVKCELDKDEDDDDGGGVLVCLQTIIDSCCHWWKL